MPDGSNVCEFPPDKQPPARAVIAVYQSQVKTPGFKKVGVYIPPEFSRMITVVQLEKLQKDYGDKLEILRSETDQRIVILLQVGACRCKKLCSEVTKLSEKIKKHLGIKNVFIQGIPKKDVEKLLRA